MTTAIIQRRRLRPWLRNAFIVSLVACYDREDYPLSPDRVTALLTFEIVDAPDSLPADGFSRVTLRASIDPGAEGDHRTVQFTTTAGTLRGGTTVSGANEVEIDGHGVALIDLESESRMQTVRVRAEVKGVPKLTAELAVRFVAVVPSTIIHFTTVPASAPADSGTLSRLTVQIAPGMAKANRIVRFTTNAGWFVTTGTTNVDIEADQTHTATVELRSPRRESLARVTASVNGVTIDTSIPFSAAPPERILVDPAKVIVKGNGEEIAVIARLLRAVGYASPGTVVDFKAFTVEATPQQLGLFHGFPTSGPATDAQVSYSPGVTTYRGLVRIVATAGGVSGETTVRVTDP